MHSLTSHNFGLDILKSFDVAETLMHLIWEYVLLPRLFIVQRNGGVTDVQSTAGMGKAPAVAVCWRKMLLSLLFLPFIFVAYLSLWIFHKRRCIGFQYWNNFFSSVGRNLRVSQTVVVLIFVLLCFDWWRNEERNSVV